MSGRGRIAKKEPAEAGSLSKSNISRISAQHHRCNGKSFQCPSNVPVLVTITLCGLLLCSVVLVPHNLGALRSVRNPKKRFVRFFVQMVVRTRVLGIIGWLCAIRPGLMLRCVRLVGCNGVSPGLRRLWINGWAIHTNSGRHAGLWITRGALSTLPVQLAAGRPRRSQWNNRPSGRRTTMERSNHERSHPNQR